MKKYYIFSSVLFIFLLFTCAISAQETTVAVIDLEAGEGVSERVAKTLSDLLRSLLVESKQYRVVDRARMEQILEEHKLQMSGITDVKSAVEVGKILNVQKIFAGSLGKIGTKYLLALKIITVKTAEVKKTDYIEYSGPEEGLTEVVRQGFSSLTGIVVKRPKLVALAPEQRATIKKPEGAESVKGKFNFRIIKAIPVKGKPHGVAVTPDGRYVYVAVEAFFADAVFVIQTSDNTAIKTMPLKARPWGIAITPDGRYVYVASDGVSVIRTSDNTAIKSISAAGWPHGVAVTPDGNYVYATTWISDNIFLIQTIDNKVIKTISVGDGPDGVTVSPDGNYVYVTNSGSDNVSVIQTSDNTVIKTISVKGCPRGVAATPDGNYVYVSNTLSDNISVIRTSDNSVIKTISVGRHPEGVAVTPDGNYVYVANRHSDNISVIRTSGKVVIETISVGDGPDGVTVSPDGNYVYVTNSGSDNVSVIKIYQ